MVEMAEKNILPSVISFIKELADTALAKKSLSSSYSVYTETTLIETLSSECETFAKKMEELKRAVENASHYNSDSLTLAKYYRNTIFALMNELRETGDSMERKTSAKYWPYPSYGEILFGV